MLRKQKSRQFHLLNEPTIGPASLSAPKETCHFLVSFLRTWYPVWILFSGSRNPDPAWVPFLGTRCGSLLRNSGIRDDLRQKERYLCLSTAVCSKTGWNYLPSRFRVPRKRAPVEQKHWHLYSKVWIELDRTSRTVHVLNELQSAMVHRSFFLRPICTEL
jgi:hypothetical protein